MDYAVQQLSPSRTVVTSFSPRKPASTGTAAAFEEGDWILHLAVSSSSSSSIACALSNGTVQVYDPQRLHEVASFAPGGAGAGDCMITDLMYYGSGAQQKQQQQSDHAIITTAQDGSITVTDLRQRGPAAGSTSPLALQTWLPRNESPLSIDLGLDGNIAAVASHKASVHFFDLRQCGNGSNRDTSNGWLGSYRDSHTDAVTQVQFHPVQRSTLLTAGEDGLVCCFDTTQATEELALQTVLNVGAPVRKIGFCCGGGGDSSSSIVYCLTGNETASLWDVQTSTCRHEFGGTGLRASLATGAAILRQPKQPLSLSTIDYLVDAHWDAGRRELLLCAGNSEGDAALYSYSDSSTDSTGNNGWKLQNTLVGGHRGVVRAWHPLYLTSSGAGFSPVIVTVGEDARLCEWNRLGAAVAMRRPFNNGSTNYSTIGGSVVADHNHHLSTTVSAPGVATAATTTRGGGGPLRRQRRHKSTAAPY